MSGLPAQVWGDDVSLVLAYTVALSRLGAGENQC